MYKDLLNLFTQLKVKQELLFNLRRKGKITHNNYITEVAPINRHINFLSRQLREKLL